MNRIIIFGAGRVGRALLQILSKHQKKITIVEKNKEICDELAVETNAVVINGDGTDPQLLDELELNKADYVFAVMGDEESNFLASVYAKYVGAKNVVSKLSEGKHSLILNRLGIEAVVAEYTLARELANIASSPTIHDLLDPVESNIELVEKEVGRGEDGKTIKELEKNNKSRIIAVYKEGKFIIPTDELVVEKGYKLILIRERR